MQGLERIRGLGPKRRQTLLEAGINSLEGLLDCLPRGYLYAQEPLAIAKVQPGEVCVEGSIQKKPTLQYYGGRSIVRAMLTDATGSLRLVWFNQPWMAKQLTQGQAIILYGLAQERGGALQVLNPRLVTQKGIIPQYRPLPGLPGKVLSGLIDQALEMAGAEGAVPEVFPEDFLRHHKLAGRLEAWRFAHKPASRADIARAQRRLAFENLLLYQMAVRQAGPQGQPGIPMGHGFSPEQFWAGLPFTPTRAQAETLLQVLEDMRGPVAMRRLVQGDVGSGKTAVAFGAALCAIRSGYQCALMAPTELLARQHAMAAERMLKPFGVVSGLLTGSMKAAERRAALLGIAEGSWQLVIGTHALIGKEVQYHRLGLAITDEQHRFGVRQRQALADQAQELSPHMLALSATPIPRSLALVLYGDLQVSVINELPPGRIPVKTRIVPEGKRGDLYRYIRAQAEKGEQSYLVCPLVEDEEEGGDERRSATALYRTLSEGPLKGIPMALTYGSQKEAEQQQALQAFYAGEARVLVSTTVIEVGMDVPNATTMVIEDAEQFGLAQLHQLRGRVGRGSGESWCFLLGEDNERLRTLTLTNDGFAIAQKDLELRGPGEFLGTRQHGRLLNTYGMQDPRLVEETARCLSELAEDRAHKPLYDRLALLATEKFADRLAGTGLH